MVNVRVLEGGTEDAGAGRHLGGSPGAKVEVQSTSNAAQEQNGSHLTSGQVDARVYELAYGSGPKLSAPFRWMHLRYSTAGKS